MVAASYRAKGFSPDAAIRNVGPDNGPLALMAAVVRLALVDALGGDVEAAEWLAGPECLDYLAWMLQPDTPEVGPDDLQAALLAKLPDWMQNRELSA